MQLAVEKFRANKNGILDIRNKSKFPDKLNRPKLNLSFRCIGSIADFNLTILNPASYVDNIDPAIIKFRTVKNCITLSNVSRIDRTQTLTKWSGRTVITVKLWFQEAFLVVFCRVARRPSNIFTDISFDFIRIQNKRIRAVKFACVPNPNIFEWDSSCI